MYRNYILILGDTVILAILTIIGFASHGETGLSFLPRMGTTFFPVLVAWFLLAPWFGLFDEKTTTDFKTFWRIPLAMFIAAPLATVLRAGLLGSAALPLFTLILGSSFALGMFLWRIGIGIFLKSNLK